MIGLPGSCSAIRIHLALTFHIQERKNAFLSALMILAKAAQPPICPSSGTNSDSRERFSYVPRSEESLWYQRISPAQLNSNR